jgi:type II restriction enzyme
MVALKWSKWTDDLVMVLRTLNLEPNEEITLQTVYNFREILQYLHPQNNHVDAKIRQQMQVLKNYNFVEFLGAGVYRIVRPLPLRSRL